MALTRVTVVIVTLYIYISSWEGGIVKKANAISDNCDTAMFCTVIKIDIIIVLSENDFVLKRTVLCIFQFYSIIGLFHTFLHLDITIIFVIIIA